MEKNTAERKWGGNTFELSELLSDLIELAWPLKKDNNAGVNGLPCGES